MTQRITDSNGWFEVKRNPLSRVGVFPYSGRSLGRSGEDAGRVFNVLRPEEELSDPECINSFKLLPWVDEHAMLGPDGAGNNVVGAEEKGVQGVIGEEVVYEDGYLYGNIKAFSNAMARLIASGKRELSAGYRCVYDWSAGVHKGQPYDCVQRRIRGNHLALVDEGRMGPSVAVQDHMTFSFDAQEAVHMPDPTQTPPGGSHTAPPQQTQTQQTPPPQQTPPAQGAAPAQANPAAKLTVAEITAVLGTLSPFLKELKAALSELQGAAPGAADPTAPKPGQEGNTDPNNPHPNLNPQQQSQGNPEDDDAMDAALKTQVADLSTKVDGIVTAVAAMDAALKALPTAASIATDTAARDKLADRLAAHVGTFDAKDKTLQQVAEYGAEKLGLKDTPKGSELVAVSGFLAAAERAPAAKTVRLAGMDAAAPAADNFVSRQLAATPATK